MNEVTNGKMCHEFDIEFYHHSAHGDTTLTDLRIFVGLNGWTQMLETDPAYADLAAHITEEYIHECEALDELYAEPVVL